jgi:RNA polymerase sigma factor (sigma-70 family)
MPPDRSRSDDDFARRLFAPGFVEKVEMASRPCFPHQLKSRRDDIIQEALIKAYHARGAFRGATDGDLLGWVLVIVKNHALDLLEEEANRPEVASMPLIEAAEFRGTDDDDLKDDPGDMENRRLEDDDASDAHDARAAIRTVLSQLTPAEREVLLLRFDREFTVRETAEALSTPERPVSEAAVKMRLHRAVERVIKLMTEAGLAPGERKTPPEATEDAA